MFWVKIVADDTHLGSPTRPKATFCSSAQIENHDPELFRSLKTGARPVSQSSVMSSTVLVYLCSRATLQWLWQQLHCLVERGKQIYVSCAPCLLQGNLDFLHGLLNQGVHLHPTNRCWSTETARLLATTKLPPDA